MHRRGRVNRHFWPPAFATAAAHGRGPIVGNLSHGDLPRVRSRIAGPADAAYSPCERARGPCPTPGGGRVFCTTSVARARRTSPRAGLRGVRRRARNRSAIPGPAMRPALHGEVSPERSRRARLPGVLLQPFFRLRRTQPPQEPIPLKPNRFGATGALLLVDARDALGEDRLDFSKSRPRRPRLCAPPRACGRPPCSGSRGRVWHRFRAGS